MIFFLVIPLSFSLSTKFYMWRHSDRIVCGNFPQDKNVWKTFSWGRFSAGKIIDGEFFAGNIVHGEIFHGSYFIGGDFQEKTFHRGEISGML